MKDSFRFKRVEGNSLTGSEGELVTVTCICKSNNIKRSFSITVPLKDGDVYYLGSNKNDNYYLRQTVSGNTFSFTVVNDPDSTSAIPDCSVVDIYYRVKFDPDSVII